MFPPRVGPGAWSGGAPVPIIGLGPPTQSDLRPEDLVDRSVRLPAGRRKIWELADTIHCSIVGTCLSTADLHHVLVRLDLPGAAAADKHELHVLAVTLASRREAGAKLPQKALIAGMMQRSALRQDKRCDENSKPFKSVGGADGIGTDRDAMKSVD